MEAKLCARRGFHFIVSHNVLKSTSTRSRNSTSPHLQCKITSGFKQSVLHFNWVKKKLLTEVWFRKQFICPHCLDIIKKLNCHLVQYGWPGGLMDMVSDFGSEDGGFESLRGRFLLNSYIHFFFLLNNHYFLIFFCGCCNKFTVFSAKLNATKPCVTPNLRLGFR